MFLACQYLAFSARILDLLLKDSQYQVPGSSWSDQGELATIRSLNKRTVLPKEFLYPLKREIETTDLSKRGANDDWILVFSQSPQMSGAVDEFAKRSEGGSESNVNHQDSRRSYYNPQKYLVDYSYTYIFNSIN